MKLKKNNRSKNWYAVYADEHGHERERTTGTSIKKLAAEIGAKFETDALKVRTGLVDPAQLAHRDAARLPILEHVADYLEWCRKDGQNADGLRTKDVQIRAFITEHECQSLRDVVPAALMRFMHGIVKRGRAPRTANLHRMNVLAFMNWCKDYRRISSHDLTRRTVPKLDEAKDCRRKRRALTEIEREHLRMATISSGRWWTYLVVMSTGLRRNEIAHLRWTDVDLETDELHVRASISKNGQEATLPIMPDAREAFEALRQLNPASALVVPYVPAVETFYRDLENAGIQSRTASGAGAPNANGERVDFHALRTTCGTTLANAGVSTMHLKRLMRHASIATTDKHYAKLRTTDLRSELERANARSIQLAATGTDGLPPKLPPTTATNRVFQGTTRSKVTSRNTRRTASVSAYEIGNYVHSGTTGNNEVQHSSKAGPVAQRPTGDSKKQARNGKVSNGLTPKLTPDSDAERTASASATDPLALMVATLSPSQRERLRELLGGVVGG